MYKDFGSIIPQWYKPSHSTPLALQIMASAAHAEAFFFLYYKCKSGRKASDEQLKEARKNWEMAHIYTNAAHFASVALAQPPF